MQISINYPAIEAAIKEYLSVRKILTERLCQLNESSLWTGYEKALIDLNKEIEKVDKIIMNLVTLRDNSCERLDKTQSP